MARPAWSASFCSSTHAAFSVASPRLTTRPSVRLLGGETMVPRLRAIFDDPPDAAPALGQLRAEREGLLRRFDAAAKRGSPEAPEILVALDPVLVMDAPHEEYAALLERAMVIAPACDAVTHADVLRAYARFSSQRGRHRFASRALRRAREVWPDTSARERPVHAALLHLVGVHAAIGHGDDEGAEREATALMSLARSLRHEPGALRVEALAVQASAWVAGVRGAWEESREALEATIDLARRARADRTLALALANHGQCLSALGADDAAALSLKKSVEMFRALGDHIHTTRLCADQLLLPSARIDPGAILATVEAAEGCGDHRTSANLCATLLERGDRSALRDRAPALLTRLWSLLGQIDAPDLDARARALSDLQDRASGDATLLVSIDGSVARRGASVIDLRARKALPGVLRALAAARVERPGDHLDVAAIFEAGWPSEKALHHAAAARVYMAIRALRTLGLRDAISTSPRGYRIDPSIELSWLGRANRI
jgi:tetratricopeptide (TPR) repeat protein